MSKPTGDSGPQPTAGSNVVTEGAYVQSESSTGTFAFGPADGEAVVYTTPNVVRNEDGHIVLTHDGAEIVLTEYDAQALIDALKGV